MGLEVSEVSEVMDCPHMFIIKGIYIYIYQFIYYISILYKYIYSIYILFCNAL